MNISKSANNIYLKIVIFIFCFTLMYFGLHAFHIIPLREGVDVQNNLPWLFSVIGIIFSIISGFIIQSKWQTWNELIDATHGEISTLKQLYMLSNHFSFSVQKMIRKDIIHYLESIISEATIGQSEEGRSEKVENAIYKLEETVLDIDYSQHPNIGSLAFDLVRKSLEFREKRLQNATHTLPPGVRLYIISATFSIIFASFFIYISNFYLDVTFTLMIGFLAYGLYILIDDLDHPYRPGHWQLTKDEYVTLLKVIEKNTESKSQ